MQDYIKRNQLQKKLKELLKNYPAVAILGARQVGKSTLAKQFLSDKLKSKKAIYLDLPLWWLMCPPFYSQFKNFCDWHTEKAFPDFC